MHYWRGSVNSLLLPEPKEAFLLFILLFLFGLGEDGMWLRGMESLMSDPP